MKTIIEGFINSMPAGFFILDDQWHLLFINDKAVELFDIKKTSLIGSSLKFVYPRTIGNILKPESLNNILESKDKNDKKIFELS